MKSLSYDVTIGVLNTWVDKFAYITVNGEEYGGARDASMAPRLMGSFGFHYSLRSLCAWLLTLSNLFLYRFGIKKILHYSIHDCYKI